MTLSHHVLGNGLRSGGHSFPQTSPIEVRGRRMEHTACCNEQECYAFVRGSSIPDPRVWDVSRCGTRGRLFDTECPGHGRCSHAVHHVRNRPPVRGRPRSRSGAGRPHWTTGLNSVSERAPGPASCHTWQPGPSSCLVDRRVTWCSVSGAIVRIKDSVSGRSDEGSSRGSQAVHGRTECPFRRSSAVGTSKPSPCVSSASD